MKRSTSAAALAASAGIFALALSGCAGSTAGGSVSTDEITAEDTGATLSLWVRPGNEAVTDAVVEAYNDTHENQIEITHVPADQYVTKFAQAAQSGSLPDILAADLVFMPQIIETGAALDITDLLDEAGALESLSPSHIMASTADDRVYGVPYVADTSLYLYNKDLFAQAGLDPEAPPTTWEGIADAAAAITALGDGNKGFYISGGAPGSLAYDFTPTIWAQGTEVVNEDGSFNWDNAATQDALGFLQQMYENGDIPDTAKTDAGDGFFAVFASGKIGIDFAGGNGVNTSTLGTDPAFEFGLAPIPGPNDGEFATFSGGDVAAITASTEHPDEAWDFIQWLTSTETSEDVYFSLPALPPRTDVTAPAELGTQFTIPAELVKSGQTYVSPYYNEVVASAQGPFLEMFQSVVFNGVDPAAATAKAQEASDEITE